MKWTLFVCIIGSLGVVFLSLIMPKGPVIGELEALGTDFGCWLKRKSTNPESSPIFYHVGQQPLIRMKINGEERQLTDITKVYNGQSTQYRTGPFVITVNWGPVVTTEGPCGTSKTFPNATLKVTSERFQTEIPAEGSCGCVD